MGKRRLGFVTGHEDAGGGFVCPVVWRNGGKLVGKVVDVAPRSAGFYTWW